MFVKLIFRVTLNRFKIKFKKKSVITKHFKLKI